MREKVIEKYLCQEVKKLGGKAYKFSSLNNNAVPDRLCLFPFGIIVFVECKAPGQLPTPLQYKCHRELNGLGQLVAVIDTKEKVDEFINTTRTWISKQTRVFKKMNGGYNG